MGQPRGGGAPQGNDNATRGKEFRHALMRALARRSRGMGWRSTLDRIADQLVESALEGQQWAVQTTIVTIDGPPKQIIEHAGVPINELTREQLIGRLATIHTATTAENDDAAVTGNVGVDAGTQSE